MMLSLLNKVQAEHAQRSLQQLYDKTMHIVSGQAFEPTPKGQEPEPLIEQSKLAQALDKNPQLKTHTLEAVGKLTGVPAMDQLHNLDNQLRNTINDWQQKVTERMANNESVSQIASDPEFAPLKDKVMPYIEAMTDKQSPQNDRRDDFAPLPPGMEQ